MDAERLFVDTSVLLDATTPSRRPHRAALDLLGSGASLCTSGQVLREYLVVATRPADVNGLGLSRDHALENVRRLRDRMRLLPESVEVHEALLALIDEVGVTGKQVHDANIVATLLVHGVAELVTGNREHFARYIPRIAVRTLDSAGQRPTG